MKYVHDDLLIGVEFILLCFDRESPSRCHRYDVTDDESPNNISKDISKTSFSHNQIRLGKFKERPIAVGDWYSLKNELMSLNVNSYTWSAITDFPSDKGYKKEFIYNYASVSTPNSYIIMGGAYATNPNSDDKIQISDEIMELRTINGIDTWGRDEIKALH